MNPDAPKTVTASPLTEERPPIRILVFFFLCSVVLWQMSGKAPAPAPAPAPLSPSRTIVYRTASRMTVSVEDMERSVCFICATEHPPLWAITECSHRVCAVCSLRMRSLYGNKVCAMCKCESERVVVVRAHVDAHGGDHTKSFEELWHAALPRADELGMYFVEDKVKDEVLAIRRMTCPVPRCRERTRSFPSKGELKRHVATAHQLTFCEVCLAHKKVFPSEYAVYSKAELLHHQQSKEAGHPSCELCGTLFYSEDELFTHRRERHEQCHLCRRHPGRPSYFRDYGELETHFRRDHFLCPEPLCLDLKFVVFETEMELKMHRAEVHLPTQKMQRSMQNQLRRMDPEFSILSPDGEGSRATRRRPRNPLNQQSTGPEAAAAATAATASAAAGTLPLHPPPPPPPPPPGEPIPRAISRHFVYGEGATDLAQRLQSLALYEQRNVQFSESLRTDHQLGEGAIGSLKSLCRQFQRGELSALDTACRIEALVGYERMERIAPTLLELQLDSYKRMQLDAAIQSRLKLIAAFPPLPTVTLSQLAVEGSSRRATTSFATATSTGTARGDGPASVLRIKPAEKSIARKIVPGTDPSKNPLALLGVKSAAALSARPHSDPLLLSSSKPKPAKKNAPSFRQAIASSSTAAIISDHLNQPHSPALDEREFPSLPVASSGDRSSEARRRGDVVSRGHLAPKAPPSLFATSENRNLPESFVLGGSEHGRATGTEAPSASGGGPNETRATRVAGEMEETEETEEMGPGKRKNRGQKTKEKPKKGQVVLRYG